MNLKRLIRLIIPVGLLYLYEKIHNFCKGERKINDKSVSFREKIWLWRNGFNSGHKYLYNLNKNNIADYISPAQYKSVHPINSNYTRLIDSKAFLPLIIENTTEIYVVVEKGRIRYSKGINSEIYRYLSESPFENFIIKPFSGSGGKGVERYSKENIVDAIKVKISKKDSFILQEAIKQHSYAHKIYPYTTNTVRIILYRNIISNKIEVATVIHRFGTDTSTPVDNSGAGGIFANVNLKNGVMEKGHIHKGFPYAGLHSRHPNTHEIIENIQIPNWEFIINDIIEKFTSLSWFDYGGLDVAITEKGWTLVEINSLPELEWPQRDKPYLKDKNIRDFFIQKGMKVTKE